MVTSAKKVKIEHEPRKSLLSLIKKSSPQTNERGLDEKVKIETTNEVVSNGSSADGKLTSLNALIVFTFAIHFSSFSIFSLWYDVNRKEEN